MKLYLESRMDCLGRKKQRESTGRRTPIRAETLFEVDTERRVVALEAVQQEFEGFAIGDCWRWIHHADKRVQKRRKGEMEGTHNSQLLIAGSRLFAIVLSHLDANHDIYDEYTPAESR